MVIEKFESDCTLIKGMNLMHCLIYYILFVVVVAKPETGSFYFSVLGLAIQ